MLAGRLGIWGNLSSQGSAMTYSPYQVWLWVAKKGETKEAKGTFTYKEALRQGSKYLNSNTLLVNALCLSLNFLIYIKGIVISFLSNSCGGGGELSKLKKKREIMY